MQIRQDLRANLRGSELTDYRQSHGASQLIQLLVQKAGSRNWPKTSLIQLQRVSFAQSPCVERRLREKNSEGVSDSTQRNLHGWHYNLLLRLRNGPLGLAPRFHPPRPHRGDGDAAFAELPGGGAPGQHLLGALLYRHG
jgi:hypothetical protein